MKLFESIKRRFIEKECRHICLFCEFKHTCDISPYRDELAIKVGDISGFKRGFDEGYKKGREVREKSKDDLINSSYNNGFADGCDSGFKSGYEQALQDYDITP